jgi:hypothetical protein
MTDNSLKFLQIGEGAARRAIAVRQQEGAAPGLFWLSGYKSDMKGTKPRRWRSGRKRTAAPVSASIIRATANRAARSPTAPSGAGSKIASPSSMPVRAARKS